MGYRIIYCIAMFSICSAFNVIAADKTFPDERDTILSVDEHYIQAFNAEDVDAAASDFTKDAVYETDDGRTLKGIDEIKKELSDQFQEMKGATLKLNVYDIDFLPDRQNATERGVSVVTHDGIQEPSSYIAEFKREDDKWRVSRVVEKPEAASAEHLNDLAWMIGDWTDKSDDGSIRTNVAWSLDRGFITRKFAVSGKGMRDLTGIEYIGWDPEKKEIRSWYFDSAGGYGNARWRREGNNWIEESSGLTPGGERASATFIFAPKDPNSFGWRSIGRRIGDESQEDLPEINVFRTSNEQIQEARGQL